MRSRANSTIEKNVVSFGAQPTIGWSVGLPFRSGDRLLATTDDRWIVAGSSLVGGHGEVLKWDRPIRALDMASSPTTVGQRWWWCRRKTNC